MASSAKVLDESMTSQRGEKVNILATLQADPLLGAETQPSSRQTTLACGLEWQQAAQRFVTEVGVGNDGLRADELELSAAVAHHGYGDAAATAAAMVVPSVRQSALPGIAEPRSRFGNVCGRKRDARGHRQRLSTVVSHR